MIPIAPQMKTGLRFALADDLAVHRELVHERET
jgi:hypothetical protein